MDGKRHYVKINLDVNVDSAGYATITADPSYEYSGKESEQNVKNDVLRSHFLYCLLINKHAVDHIRNLFHINSVTFHAFHIKTKYF